jgi:hypothetical protein
MLTPYTPLYVPKLALQHSRREDQGKSKLLEIVLTFSQQPNQLLPQRLGSRLFWIGSHFLLLLHI